MAAALRAVRSGGRSGLGQVSSLGMDLDTWQQVFTAQLRGIQNHHFHAHRKFENWAKWSADIGKVPGLTNHIQRPSMWSMFDPDDCDPNGWGDVYDETPLQVRLSVVKEYRAEPREKQGYDERMGVATDELIHHQDFAGMWRKVLKAAYYYPAVKLICEYQYPAAAHMQPEPFLMHLDGVLAFVEGRD